ncbi:E3 ubiquitin-protein ligase TRIM16-like [Nelusetta ayraudi]|uniref:E3 ubiquitin-protein ligase TRIM16-like n=1 Tax=Nelusetta ayraudi TaxID=303726 RepID=UPI003F6EF1F7
MAQSGAPLDPETSACSICGDLPKDLVTTPCGHHCSSSKKTMVGALLEKLEKTGLQAAPADHCYAAGAGDVACDVCTGRKLKALKSCLVCRASFCDSHLQPHLHSSAFKKHKLVEPSQQLQENICTRHDEVMKIFCRTDQQNICYLCTMDEHQGHHIVAAAAERTERQRELEKTRQKIQQKIQHREGDLKELQKKATSINSCADKAVKDSEDVFIQMSHLLEKRRSEVQQQVRSTQGAEVSRVKELQKKLEQEMMELKRRDAELENISQTLDHSQFLHRFSSLPALSPFPDSSSLKIRPLRYYEDVAAAVTKLRDKIQQVLMETPTNISWTVSKVDVLLPEPQPQPQPQPRSREDFLRYSRQLTLDPNTASRSLFLYDEGRKVTNMKEVQSYCDHPDRFTGCQQVLSRESLTGRCYWEVEWGAAGHWRGGELEVGVAVAYRDIRRGSKKSKFGSNNMSWGLFCYPGRHWFYHNSIGTFISGPQSSRVGVYLDHRAGLLSFYSVSGTMELLHRVQTSFSQPLHVGLWVGANSLAELKKP